MSHRNLFAAALLLLASRPVLAAEPPATLAATGLYADVPSRTIAPGVVAFRPRFPLWTDGLEKARWILLPPGTSIDAADAERWEFPVGTRLWKEFAIGGAPVETRYMERTATGWTFATYLWSADGAGATLAPSGGVRGAAEIAPGVRHDVPGRFECTACHGAQSQPVLGFSAVQLAAGRTGSDAPDLVELTRRGVLTDVEPRLLEIPVAPEPRAVAALGYLHGNCGHCHNAEGPLADLGMDLRMVPGGPHDLPAALSGALATAVGRPALTSARAAPAPHRIVPGNPQESQLLQRLSTRDPLAQMPPLGTRLVDRQAVELLAAWIRDDLAPAAAVASSATDPSPSPAAVSAAGR